MLADLAEVFITNLDPRRADEKVSFLVAAGLTKLPSGEDDDGGGRVRRGGSHEPGN